MQNESVLSKSASQRKSGRNSNASLRGKDGNWKKSKSAKTKNLRSNLRESKEKPLNRWPSDKRNWKRSAKGFRRKEMPSLSLKKTKQGKKLRKPSASKSRKKSKMPSSSLNREKNRPSY